MRNLNDFYSFTNEAQKALANFFVSIKNEGQNYPAEDIEELMESLTEHIEILICEKLRYSGNQRVDAQMILEILYSLGEPAEIVSELGAEKSERREKVNIKYKYIPVQKMLCRSSRDRWIFGVCGGFGEYFGVSSLLLRFLFVFSGVGILFYLLLSFLIPDETRMESGEKSHGADLIISAVRVGFLFFMSLIYIPVIAAFSITALMAFAGLIGLDPFLNIPFTGYLIGMVLEFTIFVLSFSVLVLLLNFIMQAHFNRGFLKIGSRNVYAFSVVASLAVIALVFGNFNKYNKYIGESSEHFNFKTPQHSVTMVFDEKQSYSPLFEKNIEITGSDETGSIEVSVVKSSYGPDEETAREYCNDIEVKADMDSEGKLLFSVSAKDISRHYYNFPKLKFIIKIPSNMEFKVETNNFENKRHFRWISWHGENAVSIYKIKGTAEIEVENMNLNASDIDSQKLSLNGANGNIYARQIKTGDLKIQLTNGNIKAEKLEFHKGSMQSATGNIKVESIKADFLKCESKVGNISLYKISINNESEVVSKVGNIKIEYAALEEKSSHDVSSEVGNISLRLSYAHPPRVVAKSNVGNIFNEFEDVKFNENSAAINVKSKVGNIKINKDELD